jgi:hypothetical protein
VIPRGPWGPEPDRGSAVVDFALVGGLVTVLFAAVVQLALALYVRNLLVSCAAEGARYAARADRVPADAVPETVELVRQALGPRYARQVTSSVEDVDGVRTVVVRVAAPFPVVGLVGPARVVHVSGHAFAEDQ